MPRARVIWVPVPGVRKDKTARWQLSVVVSPRIEGDSADDQWTTLASFDRFLRWEQQCPASFEAVVEGVAAPVPLERVPRSSRGLWSKVFAASLPVQLVPRGAGDQIKRQSATTLAYCPPTAAAALRLKTLHLNAAVASLREPGGQQKPLHLALAFQPSDLTPPAPPASWTHVYERLRTRRQGEPLAQVSAYGALTSACEFLARPPLFVLPAVERDIDQLKQDWTNRPTLSAGGPAEVPGGTLWFLPRLQDPPKKPEFAEVAPPPETNGMLVAVRVQTGGSADPVLLRAAGADRIGADGLALRLGPGDYAELEAQGRGWELARYVGSLRKTDDGRTLHLRRLSRRVTQSSQQAVRLPADAEKGFEVTIRNLDSTEAWVLLPAGQTGKGAEPYRATGGKSPSQDIALGSMGWRVPATDARCFHQDGGVWTLCEENRHEFHREVSALRAFPELQRDLGLVIDLAFPPSVTLPDAGKLRIKITGQGAEADLFPWTAYEIVHPGWFLPRTRAMGSPYYRSGLHWNDMTRSRYRLVQMDAEAGAAKLVQHVATSAQLEASPRGTQVALETRGDPGTTASLPTLRQIGLALCDTHIDTETDRAVGAAADLYSRLCDAQGPDCPSLEANPLYAEDLMHGIRVDVAVRTPAGGLEGWRSLCERQGLYSVSGEPLRKFGPDCAPMFTDEGFVVPSADRASDGKSAPSLLRMSQALFRWDGWSLVAERPGQAFVESGPSLSAGPAFDPSSPLRVLCRPKPGSLTPQRLGDRFSFRLRTAFEGGVGLTSEEADQLPLTEDSLAVFNSGCLARLDPIEPPHAVLAQEPGPGESGLQLVLRHTGGICKTTPECFLLPPATNPMVAEQHRAFDGRKAEEIYKLFVDYDELPPEGGFDRSWLDRHRDSDRLRVPYLPDPLSHGVVLIQHDPAARPGIVATLPFLAEASSCRYPETHRGPRLRLDAAKKPKIAQIPGGLRFCLPPGRMAQLEISTCPSPHSTRLFGVMDWCRCKSDQTCIEDGVAVDIDPAAAKRLDELAQQGLLGHISPGRQLTLVHAVEKPLLPPGGERLGFVREPRFRFGNPIDLEVDPGSSTVTLRGDVLIDAPSTGKLDFSLSWTETIDDSRVPEWSIAHRELAGFQYNVLLRPSHLIQFGPEKSAAECRPIPIEAAPQVNQPRCIGADPTAFEGTVRMPDAKHHRVHFLFDAASRFVDYYVRPPEKATETFNQTFAKRFTRRSDTCEVHFPATKPPEPPRPRYIVPTFAFAHHQEGRKQVTERLAGCFRVYLDRGWFSSGDDEMLALVFAQSRAATLTGALEQTVTAWGVDPAWGQRAALLPRRPILADVVDPEVRVDSLITPLRLDAGAAQRGAAVASNKPAGLNEPAPETVEVGLAAYQPQLDQEKNLLYVDVRLTAPTYMPFLRAGLARYQPYALEGQQLSILVPATWCQLMPGIQVSVVSPRCNCYEVTVLAPATDNEGDLDLKREFAVIAVGAVEGKLTTLIEDGLGTALRLEPTKRSEPLARWSGLLDLSRSESAHKLLVVERRIAKSSGNYQLLGVVPCPAHTDAASLAT